MHILIAEDNVINQRLITSLLKSLGHSGVVVDNGEKAVAAVQQVLFDVIIMDHMMPVMDGVQATQEIRSIGCDTPIIMCTAHDLSYAITSLYKSAGANGLIPKPIDKQVLAQTLAEIPTT